MMRVSPVLWLAYRQARKLKNKTIREKERGCIRLDIVAFQRTMIGSSEVVIAKSRNRLEIEIE